ncbi:MAG TPA: CHAD domain-containing protein, partial [Anaerolineales bacterium]|nr:CHAD domain-containing protein [Anaerolineales bacterium]
FARALNPQPRIQKTRSFLKGQLDDLDDLRDVQVMLVQVAETLERIPSLKPFEVFLEEREKRFLRIARKQTRALKTAELENRIERIAEELQKRRAQKDFDARVLQVVDDVYLRTTQTFGQVDPSQTETIHRLRLAFKKFRYMAEIVHPLALEYPASHLEGMHEYQSAMGDIQDIETFLHMLNDFAENNVASFDPWPARRYFETRHSEAIASFLEDKGELHIFWRAAPDQPFPWEKA